MWLEFYATTMWLWIVQLPGRGTTFCKVLTNSQRLTRSNSTHTHTHASCIPYWKCVYLFIIVYKHRYTTIVHATKHKQIYVNTHRDSLSYTVCMQRHESIHPNTQQPFNSLSNNYANNWKPETLQSRRRRIVKLYSWSLFQSLLQFLTIHLPKLQSY